MDWNFDLAGYALVYSLVGVLLLGVGYFVFDLITPGKLGDYLTHDDPAQRSISAAIVVSGMALATGYIVRTAILLNGESGFGQALWATALWGVLGIVLLMVGFVVVDALTPGKLREIICRPGFHPAAVLSFAVSIAVAMIVSASIS